MKLLVTTNARLYECEGKYYTQLVYGYSFFDRYFSFFDNLRLVAHVERASKEKVSNMLRVDGPNLEIYPVVFPHGRIGYIKNYLKIKSQLKMAYHGCDVAILRIPDQLAFQIMPILQSNNIPVGIEVTTNSWDLFAKGIVKGYLRPFLRVLWDYQQKKACRKADASSYVTSWALQRRYKPSKKTFTTNYSSVDVRQYLKEERNYGKVPFETINLMHVAGSISGVGKGHGELLRAMVLLNQRGYQTKCYLVGGGDLSAENKKLVADNHLNIEFCGVLNAAQIAKTMEKADIFVFPSYREGLPRVVIEAMATGLVCVATRLDGITELLDESVMVPIGDAEKIADIIENLAKNPEEMTKQSKRNFKKACEYTPDIMEKNRHAFYKNLSEMVK